MMMLIALSEEWRIVTIDDLNFGLQQRRDTEKGRANDKWITVGYHATLDTALLDCAKHRIRTIDVEVDRHALPALVHALDGIRADITNVLDKLGPGGRLTPATVKKMMDAVPAA
jgi:hypothetical protein